MKPGALLSGAFAALAALASSTSTFAADIPYVPQQRAPVAVAAPYSWYGFYIGIQGGYGFGGSSISYTSNAPYAAVFGASAVPVADDPGGFVGGITYGNNFQFGRIVLGTESDWSYSDIKRSETIGPITGLGARVTAEQGLDYFSTTRARAGILMTDHWLLYGTGGLASGRAEGSSVFYLAPAPCTAAGQCPFGSRAKTLWGWTAGGGIELANGPWSVKLEYLYYDLGSLNYSAIDPSLPAGVINASTKFSGSIVRGGLNYRFNWTLLDLVLGRR